MSQKRSGKRGTEILGNGGLKVFEKTTQNYHKINISYILDVLLCSIADYFYELYRILASQNTNNE